MSNMVDLEQFYTAKQAAEVLSKNSGKNVQASYIRTLAKYGKIEGIAVSTRLTLYPKEAVDKYVVEDRGVKGGRASHERAERRYDVRPS